MLKNHVCGRFVCQNGSAQTILEILPSNWDNFKTVVIQIVAELLQVGI